MTGVGGGGGCTTLVDGDLNSVFGRSAISPDSEPRLDMAFVAALMEYLVKSCS